MKISLLFLTVFSFFSITFSQSGLIFNGSTLPSNLSSWGWGQSTIEVENGAGPGGTNALKWIQGDEWGSGWSGVGFTVDPPFNLADIWAVGEITIKIKCDTGVGALRIQYESPAGKKGKVFTPIADNDWHEYNILTSELVYQDGSTAFDSTNINVVGIMAEASAVAGKVVYMTDWFVSTGPSLIVFNGIAVPNNLELWTWGTTTVEVETGGGPVAGTNALKWTQGDVSMGFGFTITPAYDLSEVWATDSVKFKMKSDAGVDTMTMMFYGPENQFAVGTHFVPIGDNQWHDYAFPLNQMVYLIGTSGFDPSSIRYVELNSGAYAGQGTPGKIIYITDWWTGNPIFDVIPPAAPTSVSAAAGTFLDNITWVDVPGETGERYNVYYSKNPITVITEQTDVVKLKVLDNEQQVEHLLFAPGTDQQVSYYYAVTCTDASGNTSEPTSAGPFTNTAKGVATFSLTPPNFVADGDLSEWSGIAPLHRAPSDGSQYVVSWGAPFTNDADLTFDCYVAVDNTYLYVAFDVEDDVVSFSDPSTNYQDSPDFHIGLYNYHGAPHTTFKRGDQPDYLIRFAQSRALVDLLAGGDSLLVPGPDYFWGESFPSGYTIEARIPWTDLAAVAGDNVFVPAEGYRIPIDIMFNDADTTGSRESMLHLSPWSDGNSWSNPAVWVYTWIGNAWEPTDVENEGGVINSYSLDQNYPNPFNPTTQINYVLEKPGMVNLKVYDLLGRHVATLVNEQQVSGRHTVNFDASGFPSGIYFYQINSGSFSSTRKMMLIK